MAIEWTNPNPRASQKWESGPSFSGLSLDTALAELVLLKQQDIRNHILIMQTMEVQLRSKGAARYRDVRLPAAIRLGCQP